MVEFAHMGSIVEERAFVAVYPYDDPLNPWVIFS